MQLWDVGSGSLLAETLAHPYSSVSCLGAAPRGGLFLTGSEPPSVEDAQACLARRDEASVSCMHMYDVRDIRAPVARFLTGAYEHHSVSFSACETYVSAAGRDHRAVVYDRRKALHAHTAVPTYTSAS